MGEQEDAQSPVKADCRDEHEPEEHFGVGVKVLRVGVGRCLAEKGPTSSTSRIIRITESSPILGKKKGQDQTTIIT